MNSILFSASLIQFSSGLSYLNWLGGGSQVNMFSDSPSLWSVPVRNKLQCEQLCAKLSACRAVNYQTKTRECVALEDKDGTRTAFSNNIYVGNVQTYPSTHACSSRPCPPSHVCVGLGANDKHVCLLYNQNVTVTPCATPSDIPNAQSVYSGTEAGDQVTYECNIGYSFTGTSKTAVCGQSGQWTGLNGHCEMVTCGNPVDISNGQWSSTQNVYNSETTLDCDAGYTFSGSSNTTRCGQYGQWEGFSGLCQLVTCGNLVDVSNGRWSSTQDAYNSEATVDCDTGYIFSGSSNTTKCGMNGQWEGFSGSCQLVDCSTPDGVENAAVDFTTTTVNSSAAYTCVSDHIYTGSSLEVVCGVTGVWTSIDGLCLPEFINIAEGKVATQKDTFENAVADEALNGSCASSNYVTDPWWQVNLGQTYTILTVSMTLRDDCCVNRMLTVYLELKVCTSCTTLTCTQTSGTFAKGSTFKYACAGANAQYLMFALNGYNAMTLCDVRVIIRNPALP